MNQRKAENTVQGGKRKGVGRTGVSLCFLFKVVGGEIGDSMDKSGGQLSVCNPIVRNFCQIDLLAHIGMKNFANEAKGVVSSLMIKLCGMMLEI